jgi:hypothetical protein
LREPQTSKVGWLAGVRTRNSEREDLSISLACRNVHFLIGVVCAIYIPVGASSSRDVCRGVAALTE